MKITSIKYTQVFHGTPKAAVAKAKKIEEKYQPAFGVQVYSDDEEILWDSEDCEAGAQEGL